MIPEFKFALREDLQNNPEFLPEQSESEATGWDVRCAEPEGISFFPFKYEKIRLGIRMFAPEGWWLELRPRSSTHAKKYLNCLYGVIDQNYHNEILLSCVYIPPTAWHPVFNISDYKIPENERKIISWTFKENNCYDTPGIFKSYYSQDNVPLRVDFGERIGQVIPVRRQLMDVTNISNKEFEELVKERSAERNGGFGSSGEK